MPRGSWFGRQSAGSNATDTVPDGIATKCARCTHIVFVRDLDRNLSVCPRCRYHHRLTAPERIAITADEGSFEESDAGMISADPLGFPEYGEKQARARAATGCGDAMVTGLARIDSHPCVLGVADFHFMGGSMGSVVGEKVARAFERGIAKRLPVVLFSASGGARMHEGLVSLMQMAKTAAAAAKLAEERLPFISVLTDPTTGGVFASYAALGDVILAEPEATVGFAGRRVGNQELGVKLPDNFQTSEFQNEHGIVDRVIHRKEMRPTLASLLAFFSGGSCP